MIYLLYNPLANNGIGQERCDEAAEYFSSEDTDRISVIGLDTTDFISGLTDADKVIICGGDGTINHFANDTYGMDYPCPIYVYKSGTGNDFLRDEADEVRDNMLMLNDYLRCLPTVTINGKTTRYINGIGYGIDGTACEVADKLREKGKKKINYTSISIKLLLFGYKCPDAKVTVDGVTKDYKRVWLASAMNGRFYGGGMMVAPNQDRMSGKLTTVILHGSGKLKTLMVFPGIFKGEHIAHAECTDVLTGNEITVEFTHPTALQIDGETVLGVTSYTARLSAEEFAAK